MPSLEEMSKQVLANELCLSILAEYATEERRDVKGRLMYCLPLAQDHIKEFVRARLAQIADDPKAITYFDGWIASLLKSLDHPPAPEELVRLIQNIEWMQDDEKYSGLAAFVYGRLTEEFTKKWPYTPETLTLKANLDLEDPETSIELLQAALKMDDSFWPARLHLAQCHTMMNQWQQACTQFARLDRLQQLTWEHEYNHSVWATSLAFSKQYAEAKQVIEKLLEADSDNPDYQNFVANLDYRLGDAARAVNLWLQLVPFSAERGLWLWVTRDDYYLEEDGTDRRELDPFNLSGCIRWSCDGTTKAGDFMLLYRTTPKGDIAYLLVADEDAEEVDPDDDDDEEEEFDYYVDARVLLKFDKPLALAAMRTSKELTTWKPLRSNFQGVSFEITPKDFEVLLRLATEKDSGGPLLCESLSRLLPKQRDNK